MSALGTLATLVRMGALALVLALVWSAPAAAMEHDHGDHAAVHHAQHHADAAQPAAHDPAQPHNGFCHCLSALCASVLEARAPMLAVTPIAQPLHHDRPAAHLARPLASVDPPPEPPRA